MSIIRYLSNIINIATSSSSPKLGRWRLKHCDDLCDRYIQNYHGEPGYPNKFKTEWISKGNLEFKKSPISKT